MRCSKALRAWVAVLLFAPASACVIKPGATEDAGPAAAPLCTPGESQACTCTDGRSGAQWCADEADHFLECVCTPPADEDTGAPADTAVDSATDTKTDSATSDADASADAAPDADPCGGIAADGTCIGSTVYYCSTPTGSSTPKVTTWTCKEYQECKKTTSGFAYCGTAPGRCEPGATQCSGSSLMTCTSGAVWSSTSCAAGCLTTDVGAACAGSGATMLYNGTLTYQFRSPGTSDWSTTTTTAPAGSVVIVAYDGGTVVDRTTTSSSGTFSVKIPSPPSKSTTIRAWLYGKRSDGSLAYAVARPGFTTVGEHATTDTSSLGSSASIFYGGWDPVTQPSGSTINYAADTGGGIFRVYDYLRYAHAAAEWAAGRNGKSLVVWMQPNVSWDCGACFNSTPSSASSFTFDSQIWIPMLAGDQSYWSDAVNAHEVGHWAMASFGRSPTEGGKHYLHCPTFPGQAWSEGWATLFSSMARNDSKYTDKQKGSYFWFDIATRTTSGTLLWPQPDPSGDVLQPIAENAVAGMGWALTRPPSSTTTSRIESNTRLFRALASSRMTVSPYARGYKRHSWDLGTGCSKTDVYEYAYTVPMFADFLDALLCSGEATNDEVNLATPSYPYSPLFKLCK